MTQQVGQSTSTRPGPSLPLWPLPLAAGLLPAAGVIAALQISMHEQLIPACNPLLDGCVSVSRAGRYGLANIVFRATLLPAAALQGVTWLVCSRWMLSRSLSTKEATNQEATAWRGARWMGWLGLTAAVFLVLYGTFLGIEGPAYRWLRQYGTIVYFGFTFLCMLLLAGRLRADPGPVQSRRASNAVFGLCCLLLLLGVGNTMLGPLFGAEMKDRIENVTEWWAALAFTLVFVVLAALWRETRIVVRRDHG